MSKKSRRQKRRERTNKTTSTQLRLPPLRWLSHFWKLIVFVSVVLTILVSFLSLSPSITVTPTQTFDPKDPMATPFVITNESLLPIHSVDLLCGINKIYSSLTNSGVEKLGLGYATPPISILYRNEQKAFLCPPAFKFPTPIDTGDITIDISFRPDFLFWHKHRSARFVTGKDSSGIVRWYPKPLSERK